MPRKKILILEDDIATADLFARMLRNSGNDVTVCTRFEDAKAQMAAAPPDAVLADVRVGPYNGLQLAHLFRLCSPNGKLVVVTGFDDLALRREVQQLDAELILKPVAGPTLEAAFKVS